MTKPKLETLYQIVLLRPDRDSTGQARWCFVAHGAPYSKADAGDYQAKYGPSRCKLLPCKREVQA